MRKLFLLTAVALAAYSCSSCNKKNLCPDTVDVVVKPNTTITKMVATHVEGMGIARFTDSTLVFNAVPGTIFTLQSVHEKDTVMTVDVNGKEYQIQPFETIQVPVYCQ